jgi:hypothetical protein
MKRCLPLLVLALLLPLAFAEDAPRQPTSAERVELFQRNQVLIQTLVQSGLRLAKEEEPLPRAEACGDAAQRLAEEIRQAVANHEQARLTELGQHLQALLDNGVVANLRKARRQIPAGSTYEKNLFAVRDRITAELATLEKFLAEEAEKDQELSQRLPVLVRESRAAVEKALDENNATSPPVR